MAEGGDTTVHLIGLHYLIHEPWSSPPGKIMGYGDGVATSIVYTDSVPIIAIPFKAVVRLFRLKGMLQPYGIFIAAGFILQGVFAYRLFRRLSQDRWISLFATPLLLFAPPMLARLPYHLALGAHWLVLWALCLNIEQGGLNWKRNLVWLSLLGIALGTHFYLFVMCTILYGAAFTLALFKRQLSIVRVLTYSAAFCALVVAAGWFYGYFVPTDPRGGGYGSYKMNLISFFNPLGWSVLFPNLATSTDGEYEGFAWLGAGLLLLSLLGIRSNAQNSENQPNGTKFNPELLLSPVLIGIFTCVLALALTPHLNLGNFSKAHSLCYVGCACILLATFAVRSGVTQPDVPWRRLFTTPMTGLLTLLVGASLTAVIVLPWVPDDLLEIARASGRMSWPVFYWFAIWVILHTTSRFSVRAGCLLLLLCTVIQGGDLAPNLAEYRRLFSKNGHISKELCRLPSEMLTDTLWKLGSKKKHLWIITDRFHPKDWDRLGLLACRKGMNINHPVLARQNETGRKKREEEILQLLETGRLPDDAVYYIYPDSRRIAEKVIRHFPESLSVTDENSVTVLTKAGEPSPELARKNLLRLRQLSPFVPIAPGQTLSFKNAVTSIPPEVFSGFDAVGGWSFEPEAFVNLKAQSLTRDLKLSMTVLPFLNAQKRQTVKVYANDLLVGEWQFNSGDFCTREIVVPKQSIPGDSLVLLRFDIAFPTSPMSLKKSEDPRTLGIRILQITQTLN